MHDPMEMSVVQGVRNGRNDLGRFRVRETVLFDPGRQIAALDQLGHHVAQSILRWSRIVDGHDVGMVQAGQNSGFGDVEFDVFRTAYEVAVRHLDRHRPLQDIIVALVNRTKTPSTQDLLNAVSSDLPRLPHRILGSGLGLLSWRITERTGGFVALPIGGFRLNFGTPQ